MLNVYANVLEKLETQKRFRTGGGSLSASILKYFNENLKCLIFTANLYQKVFVQILFRRGNTVS